MKTCRKPKPKSRENVLSPELETVLLARRLHGWYLEATKKLKPESYNPEAQKRWRDLTEDQRGIDLHIAKKILKHYNLY